MQLPFHTLDVFTDRRFGGNPLAVVHDADRLSGEAMQAIAREFNLSETVFVLKPENPAHSARIRIFTPARELSFAGHPTIGAAVLLAQLRAPATNGERDAIVALEEGIGTVRVGVRLPAGAAPSPSSTRPSCRRRRAPCRRGAPGGGARPHPERDRLREPPADALLRRQHLRLRAHRQPRGDGARARQRALLGGRVRRHGGDRGVPLHAPVRAQHGRVPRPHVRARQRRAGGPRDGLRRGSFAGVVHHFDDQPDGVHKRGIEQGYEMGRPSLIYLTLVVEGGRLGSVRIGGHAVRVAEGRLTV